MRIKNQRTDIKLALEMLARLTKEKDLTLQRLKDMESTVKNASSQIPPLKNSVERMASEKHAMEAERKQYAASIEDLKRDEDICMSAYLKVSKLDAEMVSESNSVYGHPLCCKNLGFGSHRHCCFQGRFGSLHVFDKSMILSADKLWMHSEQSD